MAEVEVNYASVVFKAKKTPQHAATKEQEEETVYEEVKVKEEHQGDKSDSEGLLTDTTGSRLRHYQQLTCCLTTSCVILLFGIIAVVVHLSSLTQGSDIKDLLVVKHNLTDNNNKLSSENENLRRNQTDLADHLGNLTQVCAVLESKITNLTAEKQNLTSQITQLETDKKTLTEQIREMEEEQLRLNVSRAQWTINAYCPSQSNSDWRRCQGCVPGWLRDESSCYVIIDGFQESRTWDEAQEFCRQRGSHLAVIGNADEKAFITDNSWHGQGISGYWLGLRRQHGRWTWVDGSSLTESSWIQPPINGLCAISLSGSPLRAVDCRDRNQFICERKALSV
ncbi:uncharacterized protein ACBR49_004939 [Aulostomus maculatus]